MQQRSSFPLNREFDVSLNLNLTRLNRVKPGLGESCESDRETKRTRGSVKRERKKKGTVLEKKKRVHDAYSLSVTRWFTLIYRRRSMHTSTSNSSWNRVQFENFSISTRFNFSASPCSPKLHEQILGRILLSHESIHGRS